MLFPTLSDTWGLVVNEAMAMGLPVLGSVKSQAVTELIEDGVSGWWFDPTSPQDLERAVDRALAGFGRDARGNRRARPGAGPAAHAGARCRPVRGRDPPREPEA